MSKPRVRIKFYINDGYAGESPQYFSVDKEEWDELTDDELVEAMSKAFHEANNYTGSWDGPDFPFKNSIRLGMRAALAVVRKEET